MSQSLGARGKPATRESYQTTFTIRRAEALNSPHCTVSLKSIANTSQVVPKSLKSPGSPLPAPPPAGTGSGDHGGYQTFRYRPAGIYDTFNRNCTCTRWSRARPHLTAAPRISRMSVEQYSAAATGGANKNCPRRPDLQVAGSRYDVIVHA